jgi:HSF-type DNA-binding
MSWHKPPNKSRGGTSCPHSSLMRLAHSARHPVQVALTRSLTGTMHAPVLASMSPPRSLGDLLADAIQESIDVRSCIPSDLSPRGIGACLELPTKLHAILSSSDFEGAVSWMPHGYAWKIKDLNLFASKVLPMFVDGGRYPENYNSFIRMLISFGFKQVTRGPDTSAYYHEVRGAHHTH